METLTRTEQYLSAIAGESDLPQNMKPITREEHYLQAILDKGAGGGGGEGGSSKPLFPTITIESTFDENFNPISTDIDFEQGMCIDNLNVVQHAVQPSLGREFTQTYFCGVVRVSQWDDATNSPIYRYLFSCYVDEGVTYELKVNEATQEIESVEVVDLQINLVCNTNVNCYKNMVYKLSYKVALYEDSVEYSDYAYAPLPLSIAVLRCQDMQSETYRIELAMDSYSSDRVYVTVFSSAMDYRAFEINDIIGRIDNIQTYSGGGALV